MHPIDQATHIPSTMQSLPIQRTNRLASLQSLLEVKSLEPQSGPTSESVLEWNPGGFTCTLELERPLQSPGPSHLLCCVWTRVQPFWNKHNYFICELDLLGNGSEPVPTFPHLVRPRGSFEGDQLVWVHHSNQVIGRAWEREEMDVSSISWMDAEFHRMSLKYF